MTTIATKAIDRVEGPAKVTGHAAYPTDVKIENLAQAVMILSTIAKGRITGVDISAAEKVPGVIKILTHQNAPKLPYSQPKERPVVEPRGGGQPLKVLQNDEVMFNGQPIGVVIADTLEQAELAAALVKFTYEQEAAVTNIEVELEKAIKPQNEKEPSRGDVQKAFATAEVSIEQTYTIAAEYHAQIGPFATVAQWDGSHLTIYDSTQWVGNVRDYVALTFGMDKQNIEVLSRFVGGAFGSGLRTWPHVILAVMAAQATNRPVKLQVTRSQAFTSQGYRPHSIQTMKLAATKQGKLQAISHTVTTETSSYEDYFEIITQASSMLYTCPNFQGEYRLSKLNLSTPGPMRAPGEVTGAYAIECAMDELAYQVGIDPLELRLLNYAETDPSKNIPWSSKSLRECYQKGAAKFGWSKRNPQPRSMRDGRYLVGWGMATGTYPARRSPAAACVRLLADGTIEARSATHEFGTGTYTAMSLIAAEAMGVEIGKVRFALGDTAYPTAPESGGSLTLASVGSAVQAAAAATKSKLFELVSADRDSPLHGIATDQLTVENGRVFAKTDKSKGETYVEILARHHLDQLEATVEAKPGDESQKYSMHSFSALFCEVYVDPDLGEVKLKRFVGAFAAGRIVSYKTAHSQITGGIVGGVGMALTEQRELDHHLNRIMNTNLADYLVPVNPDIPPLDAFFVDEQDEHVNPLGAKGVGELGIVSVAAAIANAVYHATGKRIRDLPITPDKLLG